MKHIVITNYSDPVCVWCWGTEPIFRAMETHYPNLFSIRYVMGGMVRDLSDFNDEENGIGGGDADKINAQLREHLAESTAVHHMPVAVDKYHLFRNASIRPSLKTLPIKRPRSPLRTWPTPS